MRPVDVLATAVIALAGCGPSRPAAAPSALTASAFTASAFTASSRRLPAPPPVAPGTPGAAYLTALADQLQPKWRDFLEDCRMRLPRSHPLNQPGLTATYELAIDRHGVLVAHHALGSSGNGDFDTAVADVLADASALPAPPDALISDDELAHVRWQFARDRRQAGPATARLVHVELPLLAVIDQMLGRGALVQAARRIAAVPDGAADRGAATERVMIAALREALASANGTARRTAVEACGRARVHALTAAVRDQLGATADPELRLAAIVAAGALGDRAAVPALVGALHEDLALHSPHTAAGVGALVALGHAGDAAQALRAVLDAGPDPTALAAIGSLPASAVPALGKLAAWASKGDAAVRGAVCAALPVAAPAAAVALIARGLGDPDARVRATCAAAARREDPAHPDAATLARLRALARDRDLAVRANAVAALGALDPAHPVRAADDPADAVRAAFAARASEAELRVLVGDRAPEVRAAALRALGDRGHAAAVAAAADPSPAVRLVAVAALIEPGDAALLGRLAGDDSPEVATAALIRLAGLRGRAAATGRLLEQLATAPAGSPERARIALAWLLAS